MTGVRLRQIAARARARWKEDDSTYWHKAYLFLGSIPLSASGKAMTGYLTKDQQSWLSSLRSQLAEPWE